MRLDCYDITEDGTGVVYTVRFSPYLNIPPTIQLKSGGPVANVVVYSDGVGDYTYRKTAVFIFAQSEMNSLEPQSLQRLFGPHRLIITNPDETQSWLELDGGQGEFYTRVEGCNSYGLRSKTTPVGCTVEFLPFEQFGYITMKITTTSGYVYNLRLYSAIQPPTISLDPSSTTLGVGETLKAEFVWFVDKNGW
jgi:hypothetical protein